MSDRQTGSALEEGQKLIAGMNVLDAVALGEQDGVEVRAYDCLEVVTGQRAREPIDADDECLVVGIEDGSNRGPSRWFGVGADAVLQVEQEAVGFGVARDRDLRWLIGEHEQNRPQRSDGLGSGVDLLHEGSSLPRGLSAGLSYAAVTDWSP